jgi:hypothetical protein
VLTPQVDDTAANDAEDTLVEMAFHVPASNVDYQGTEGDVPSKMLSEQLLALTDAGGAAAEEAVCAFDDVAILAPRGRFSVEMHHGFLKLSGQTQDFKIRWARSPVAACTGLDMGCEPQVAAAQTRASMAERRLRHWCLPGLAWATAVLHLA